MKHFEALRAKLAEIADVKGAIALLSWDQEVMMPPAGIASRARQTSTLSGIQHEMLIAQAAPLLRAVEEHEFGQMDEWHQGNIRALRREFDRMEKLPTSHVMEVAQVASQSQQIWANARAANQFSAFQPWLEKLVQLRRKEAAYYGYGAVPYDALLDGYEPGMTTEKVKRVFEEVKPGLTQLIQRIRSQAPVNESCFDCEIPANLQLKFGEEVAQRLGYTADHGRQDISSHPFSIAISPEDVRITTKVSPKDLREMLYSTIHEAGHALYELGLSMEHLGLPAAEACSLAMHESQSRLWENNVGRSIAFWEHFQGIATQHFPGFFASTTPLELAKAVNVVKPSLIRISADELTYHFHIIARFELESDLINGVLEVADLPAAWNDRMEKYLGIRPTTDAQGCLQDIHWSFGSFGYFPTYSLGSFYAAQFMAAAERDIPHLTREIAAGNFLPLLQWLRTKIHSHGRNLLPRELIMQATGKEISSQPLMKYLSRKLKDVYRL